MQAPGNIQAKSTLLLIQAQVVIAAAMTGIIWFVQRITYPQFLDLTPDEFTLFHERYTSALTPIVAPLMIAELGLSILALARFWGTPGRAPIAAASALTAALWLSTFLIQVPIHDRLANTWSESEIRKLVDTNWIRTILWSIRLGLLLVISSRFFTTPRTHR